MSMAVPLCQQVFIIIYLLKMYARNLRHSTVMRKCMHCTG
jgi:hypothetical protein